uniref:Uncharacterized protein n=1 Tax=Candidatus Kentrum sp. TC TaxID=2126339 RepID=A0A451A756_9GAMM|nr:MAG: hypothetical protein BECKTC1821F_GA0114240_10649 [Candidatus Kentron sp. TC]
MGMDLTALGIILGIIGSAIFIFLEYRRRHHIDIRNNIGNIILIFFSVAAIPYPMEIAIERGVICHRPSLVFKSR